MKVIDLLNKIANNEEVPNFKIYGDEYHFSRESGFLKDVHDKNVKWYIYYTWLNDEIEIIEEKPKKLTHLDFADKVAVGNKINEIIDYLLEKESEK